MNLARQTIMPEIVHAVGWDIFAECAQGEAAQLDWFAEPDEYDGAAEQIAACKAVCARCAVVEYCRADADRHEPYRQKVFGTRAGMDAAERRRLTK